MHRQEAITLHFDPHHAKKMLSGKGVCQLGHEYIAGKKGHPLQVQVHRAVATRLKKAHRQGKSTRVRMDELHGEGVKEWFQNLGNKIKDVYNKIKPTVAPLVKEGVGKLADMAADAAKPFLPQQVNQLIQDNKGKAVDWLGQQTGAYGIMQYPVYGGAVPYGAVLYPQAYANWSTIAMPLAPAMLSKPVFPGFGMSAGIPGGEPVRDVRGGSFKAI